MIVSFYNDKKIDLKSLRGIINQIKTLKIKKYVK